MTPKLFRALRQTTALIPATFLATLVAHANPLDGQVVAGTATITTPDPATLLIQQQTNKAIIDWRSFNIGAGETTQFVVPDTTGVTLNRVVGSQNPSQIMGTLKSNGTVMVINPDGMLFGPNSVINVGSLLATTSDINNSDFMAGNYRFGNAGNPAASIVNQGSITVQDAGMAALVAPGVRNEGVIAAKLGKVTLGAANTFSLDFYGDNLINFDATDILTADAINTANGKVLADRVSNTGKISADGGTVVLSAATARKVVNSVVNNTGVIEANSVGVKGGKIVLSATTASTKSAADAPPQTVKVSGTLSAKGKNNGEKGGKIIVSGEQIALQVAHIDASGIAGGGHILIGGDVAGGKGRPDINNPSAGLEFWPIPTATAVWTDVATTISADGGITGNGGKIVVWSDQYTQTAASISAKGGSQSGNGGLIETSGKELVSLTAADASAANGTSGTWLLDPLDIHISSAANANYSTAFGVPLLLGYTGIAAYPTAASSVVNTATLDSALNSGTNVMISTRGTTGGAPGNIYVDSDIAKTAGGSAALAFDSVKDVIFGTGVNITSTSGALSLGVFADGNITGNSVGRISTNGGTLLFQTANNVNFHSAYDLPTHFIFNVNAAPSATVETVNISFDQDVIGFSHDNTLLTVPTNGVKLIDSTATGSVEVYAHGLNAALSDYAITILNNRTWFAGVDANQAFGATTSAALDGSPEIVSDGFVNIYPTKFGSNGIVPILEIKATNPPNCLFGLTCIATGPAAKVQVANVVNPVSQTMFAPQTNNSAVQVSSQDLYIGPTQIVWNNSSGGVASSVPGNQLQTLVNTWGLNEAGNQFSQNYPAYYAPIDTMTFSVKGQSKTLNAYANIDYSNNGLKYPPGGGPFQCTALVSQYLSLLGFSGSTLQLPSGGKVASMLASDSHFISSNSPQSTPLPQIGSIISFSDSNPAGHVAIVKGITLTQDTAQVTLIENNMTVKGDQNFAINQTVTFKNVNGSWIADPMIYKGVTFNLINWVTPTSVP